MRRVHSGPIMLIRSLHRALLRETKKYGWLANAEVVVIYDVGIGTNCAQIAVDKAEQSSAIYNQVIKWFVCCTFVSERLVFSPYNRKYLIEMFC